ncbi:MAG TPA: twin-arginine translocase TatA/TatE family subunit [Candidatus Saccharimonadales bacterium]|nr:twin-arginine translocase TatA/TatE family subunit [Candidatus Saccharimonadales bacterium]
MPFGITPLHVILVLVIALIILGPGKLPKVGSALGKSIREFRQAVPATRDAFASEVAPPSTAGPVTGGGAAVGAKVGSVAGRSVRGFRTALSETREAFQTEVSPASSPPAPVSGGVAAPGRSTTEGGPPSSD